MISSQHMYGDPSTVAHLHCSSSLFSWRIVHANQTNKAELLLSFLSWSTGNPGETCVRKQQFNQSHQLPVKSRIMCKLLGRYANASTLKPSAAMLWVTSCIAARCCWSIETMRSISRMDEHISCILSGPSLLIKHTCQRSSLTYQELPLPATHDLE